MEIGSHLETLAPRSAYDKDDVGVTERLPLFTGLFFGIPMGLLSFAEHWSDGKTPGTALAYEAVTAVVTGLIFGFLMPGGLGRLARRVNDRLYAGDPSLVRPPPEGFFYRLPCGWMRTPAMAVHGVLYLGRGGMRFDPL